MKKLLFFICVSFLFVGSASADFSICPDEPGWHVCGDPTDVLLPKNDGIDQDTPAIISILNGNDTHDDLTALASLPGPDLTATDIVYGNIHIEEVGWQS